MEQVDADLMKSGGFNTRLPLRHIDRPPAKLPPRVAALGLDVFMVRYLEHLGIEATPDNIERARETMKETRTTVSEANMAAHYRSHGQANDELIIVRRSSARLSACLFTSYAFAY